MATLAISDELYKKLERVARGRRISIEQQAEEYIEEAVAHRLRGQELRRSFSEIADLTPKGVEQIDSVDLLREDRER